MSEGMLLVVWVVKILLVVVCAVLYRLGGWFEKKIRRFLMPVFYILGCSLIGLWKGTFSWWILLSLPMLIGSLCLGYGSPDFWEKVIRRLIYGAALGISFFPFAFVYGTWVLFAFHLVLCMASSAFFGAFNPFKEAVSEEATIATCSLLLPVMMI